MYKHASAKINLKRVLFLILLFSIFSCSFHHTERDLIGVWKGGLNGNEFVFEFKIDHTCMFRVGDKSSGSVKEINGDFETDFFKIPIPLTVRNIPQLPHPLHTIIQFKRDDSIQIANFAPRWRLRPIGFKKNSSVILKRVNKKNHIKNIENQKRK